jgi:hypothetical protein
MFCPAPRSRSTPHWVHIISPPPISRPSIFGTAVCLARRFRSPNGNFQSLAVCRVSLEVPHLTIYPSFDWSPLYLKSVHYDAATALISPPLKLALRSTPPIRAIKWTIFFPREVCSLFPPFYWQLFVAHTGLCLGCPSSGAHTPCGGSMTPCGRILLSPRCGYYPAGVSELCTRSD